MTKLFNYVVGMSSKEKWINDYLELIKHIVRYAMGLPLMLTELGSQSKRTYMI